MESVSDLSPSARSRSPQKHREHASDAVVLLGLRILSGLHPAQGGEGRLEARAFIRNKCSRILLPFLIIGFLWLLPIRFALNYPNYRNLPLWKVVLKECLWGVRQRASLVPSHAVPHVHADTRPHHNMRHGRSSGHRHGRHRRNRIGPVRNGTPNGVVEHLPATVQQLLPLLRPGIHLPPERETAS